MSTKLCLCWWLIKNWSQLGVGKDKDCFCKPRLIHKWVVMYCFLEKVDYKSIGLDLKMAFGKYVLFNIPTYAKAILNVRCQERLIRANIWVGSCFIWDVFKLALSVFPGLATTLNRSPRAWEGLESETCDFVQVLETCLFERPHGKRYNDWSTHDAAAPI